jgi:hypothetical protein
MPPNKARQRTRYARRCDDLRKRYLVRIHGQMNHIRYAALEEDN